MKLLMGGMVALIACSLTDAHASVIQYRDLETLLKNRNLKVEAAKNRVSAQKAREGHLFRSFLPDIQASYSQERFQKGVGAWETQPHYGVEMSVNLFNGGKDQLEEKVREARSAQSEAALEQTFQDQLAHARRSYVEALFQKRLVDIFDQHLKLNQKNLQAAERRIRSGVATQIDRVEFQMQAVGIKQNQVRAKARQFSHLRQLGAVLRKPELKLENLQGPLDHFHEWQSEMREFSGEKTLSVSQLALKAQETDHLASKRSRWWMPSADLYAGWIQNNRLEEDLPTSGDRRETVVGVRVKFSIGNALTDLSEASAIRAERNALESQKDDESLQVQARFDSLLETLKSLHGLVHEAEENVERGEKYLKLTASQYRRGVKNSLDMLSATNRYVEFLVKQAEIDRTFEITRAETLKMIALQKR